LLLISLLARQQLIDGYEFVLKPIDETKPEVYDDLLNDQMTHKFLDSLLYVMLPVRDALDEGIEKIQKLFDTFSNSIFLYIAILGQCLTLSFYSVATVLLYFVRWILYTSRIHD